MDAADGLDTDVCCWVYRPPKSDDVDVDGPTVDDGPAAVAAVTCDGGGGGGICGWL